MMQFAIEPVAAITAGQGATLRLDPTPPAQAAGVGAPDAFAALLQGELGQVNQNVGAAEAAMRDLAAGKPVELHEVMITMERARLSVQTFVQIRNKLIESYQDLMRMQL